jgi:hypothetical protein
MIRVRRFFSTVAVTLALCVAPDAASSQPWVDGLIVRKTDIYELYAPTERDIEQASGALDYAVTQFKARFGTAPPKVAIALLDDNPPAGFDDSSFRQRNLPVMTWLTDRGWDAQGAGIGSQPTHRRPFSLAEVLPHEACHLFLRAYVDQRLGAPERSSGRVRTQTNHYGHPDVPDWLDESAAGLCERPDEQAKRRTFLKANVANHLPFDQLFSMAHPFSGPLQMRASPVAGQPTKKLVPGMRVGAMTFTANMSPEQLQQARMFYAQAQSVGKFLSERAGPTALARIAEGLARGRPLKTLLQQLNLPGDTGVLEREWLKWLGSQD